jgi:hypothetical protein
MKNQFNKYYIALFCLCSNFMLFAEPGVGNDTNDLENVDAPAAPINDYLWILALVGLIFVFMKLKAHSRQFDNLAVLENQKSVNNNF